MDEFKNDGLTENQRKFCELYAKSSNVTDAYFKAYGGKREQACSNGLRLLKQEKIAKYLNRMKRNNGEVADIIERKILLSRLARMTEEEIAIKDETRVKIALQSIEILNKMEGIYVQKVDVNHNIKPIEFLQPIYGIKGKSPVIGEATEEAADSNIIEAELVD